MVVMGLIIAYHIAHFAVILDAKIVKRMEVNVALNAKRVGIKLDMSYNYILHCKFN